MKHRRKTGTPVSTWLAIIITLTIILQPYAVPAAHAATAYVRVNQVGYITNRPKQAYLMTDTAASGNFQIKKASDNSVVHTASIGANQGPWSSSFTKVYVLDFTSFKTSGTYYITAGGVDSEHFKIDTSDNLYDDLLDNAQYFFEHFQRDGDEPNEHKNDEQATVYKPPNYGSGDVLLSDLEKVSGADEIDVSGGWYDAGDYVKFVSNTAYAADLMLIAVRDRPDLVGDGQSADFYDEARYGLDWLNKMWDDSTETFYYQVGIGSGNDNIAGDHDIWRLPEVDDTLGGSNTYYKYIRNRPAFRAYAPGAQISPNLAGRLSAAFALCYQVYKDTDKPFADQCLLNAQHIFDLAKTTNPGQLLTASPHAYYPEDEWRDDMELGAAELYLAMDSGDLPSGLPHTDPTFYLEKAASWAKAYIDAGATDTLNLYDISAVAHYEAYRAIACAGRPSGLQVSPDDLIADLKRQLDIGVAQANSDPFSFGFTWDEFDAAGHGLGLAITASLYEELSGDTQYAAFGQNQMGGVLGANAWGSSFVVGIGSGDTYPQYPHHQVANIKEIDLRGAVVNGPNAMSQLRDVGDYCFGDATPPLSKMHNCPSSFPPPSDPFSEFNQVPFSGSDDGAAYVDDVRSWATVENAIDFTATSILAFVRQYPVKGTVVDLLGDKDHFHRGDPVDDPPLSIEAQKTISATAENGWASILDEPWGDRPVGATHFYYVPHSKVAPISSATLTFKFRGCQWIKNDLFIYQQENFQGVQTTYPLYLVTMTDTLGFEPEPGWTNWPNEQGPDYTVTIDLSQVPVRILSTKEDWGVPGTSWPGRSQVPESKKDVVNLLHRLADGQFDLVFLDDTQIDYVELQIEYGANKATPVGERVTVAPAPEVYVTFGQVTGAGETTVAKTAGSGAVVPPNYQIDPNAIFDVQTTASYLGSNIVQVFYDETLFADEDRVRLLRNEGGQYVDCTLFADQENNWVVGQGDPSSEFAVAKFTGALLKEFTLYATDSVYLGTENVQNLGNVGSDGSITFNMHGTLAGNLWAMGPINVGSGATVDGNVLSADEVTVYGQVNGSVIEYGNLTPIDIPTTPYDFVNASDQHFTSDGALVPGNYGDVVVYPGVTLSLESGAYYMRAFDVGDGASLVFNTTEGPVILRIGKPDGAPEPTREPLTFGKDVSVYATAGGSGSPAFYEVLRAGNIEIGDRTTLFGTLLATQNTVILGRDCVLAGSVYAQSVHAGISTWQPSYTYYATGDRVLYEGKIYECRQGHTSMPGWEPPNVPALWHQVTPVGVSEWAPGTAYAVGSVVTYNGVTYVAIQGHTSLPGWEPPNVPSLWQEQ